MNSLVLLLICVAILVIGYIFYGGWLCKQWGVGESKTETPAHTMEDGVDYVPAKAPVLMGHHFSSSQVQALSQDRSAQQSLVGCLSLFGFSSEVSSSVVCMTLAHFLHLSAIKASQLERSSPLT